MSEGELVQTTGKVIEKGAEALEKGMVVASKVVDVGEKGVNEASQVAGVASNVGEKLGEGVGETASVVGEIVPESGNESNATVPVEKIEKLQRIAESDPHKAIVEIAEMNIAHLGENKIERIQEDIGSSVGQEVSEEDVIDVEWREIVENDSIEVNDKVDFVMERAREHWGKRLVEELLMLLVETEDEEVKKKCEHVRELHEKDNDLDIRTLLIVTLRDLPGEAVREYFDRVGHELESEKAKKISESDDLSSISNSAAELREVNDGGIKAISEGDLNLDPIASSGAVES